METDNLTPMEALLNRINTDLGAGLDEKAKPVIATAVAMGFEVSGKFARLRRDVKFSLNRLEVIRRTGQLWNTGDSAELIEMKLDLIVDMIEYAETEPILWQAFKPAIVARGKSAEPAWFDFLPVWQAEYEKLTDTKMPAEEFEKLSAQGYELWGGGTWVTPPRTGTYRCNCAQYNSGKECAMAKNYRSGQGTCELPVQSWMNIWSQNNVTWHWDE